ncbi:MAG: bifunctional folylpolyglutamate synthase/dihydrofolate synthase [Candidatus Omnitrophica bacterium]|nr:bifunctional folylpolyglutamate synthase/dihydrofolate synthase [Candidatus Omnitrophota bacterium]
MSFSLDSYLNSFLNWESRLEQAGPSDFDLSRVHRLLEAVGHPEDQLKFVHVAGSKGKGSTCAFLASILRSAGYRVGLYTSPHLYSHCERIRVLEPGGIPGPFEGMISEEDLIDRVRFYQARIDALRDAGVEITFFEFWTAIALTHFAHKKAQIVVLETGLGGRLDATNAVDTLVCGITSIGLEHTQILGDTLVKIAREKGGIIKAPSQKVVLAPQEESVMQILRERCEEFFIMPSIVGKDVRCVLIHQDERGSVFYIDGRRAYSDLKTSLVGEHQVMNAATAVAMAEDLEVFGFLITEEAVRQGIVQACWPARFEIISREPRVIVDCAHTPESMEAMVRTFQSVYPGKKAVVVMGMGVDKKAGVMVELVTPIAQALILTKSGHPRAMDPHSMSILPGALVVEPFQKAMQEAFYRTGQDGIILVCGSVFMAAEARDYVSV